MKFRHILFPVDFSERSRAAARFVLSLARQSNSRITLLNVISPALFPLELDYQETETALVHRMEQLACAEFPSMKVECAVEFGDAADGINDYAQTTHADLIAMPTHGVGCFRRMLLGSTAAKVVYDAEIPVWTAPHAPEPTHRPEPQPKLILAAVDRETGERRVLDTASELAERTGAKLEVISPGEQPGAAIRCAALRKHADLVVTARGSGPCSGLIQFKVTAYEIVREAPCPVLTV